MGGLGFQTTGQSCPMILAFGGAISESAPRERQGELEAQIPGMQLPRGCALGGLCTQAAALPAVDEVGDRVVLAERGRIQVHADLHIVTCHDPHSGLVFILENLPL